MPRLRYCGALFFKTVGPFNPSTVPAAGERSGAALQRSLVRSERCRAPIHGHGCAMVGTGLTASTARHGSSGAGAIAPNRRWPLKLHIRRARVRSNRIEHAALFLLRSVRL